MFDYLRFPQKNEVGKKIAADEFIKKANLTPSESRCLAQYLGKIEILYDFPFDDGEIVVLLAEFKIENFVENMYAFENFVKAIAQSLPYRVLLIVKYEGIIQFFAFYEKENTLYSGRSRVFTIRHSSSIILMKHDFMDYVLLDKLRDAVEDATSAKELYEMWYGTLPDEEFDLTWDISKYRELKEQYQNFIVATERNSWTNEDYFENHEFNVYTGKPLDIDDIVDHQLFIEFCSDHARLLYKEYSGLMLITEKYWIEIYIDCCNEYAESLFSCVLDERCVKIIVMAFWNDSEMIHDSDYYHYDIEELKELIDSFIT